jgi:hypothetical protein
MRCRELLRTSRLLLPADPTVPFGRAPCFRPPPLSPCFHLDLPDAPPAVWRSAFARAVHRHAAAAPTPRFAELAGVRRICAMNASTFTKPTSSTAVVLLLLSAYSGGYFWFRHLHTFSISPPPASITVIRSSSVDSLLLALFYPALCLDARFGPARTFYWVGGSNGALNVYSNHYPFSPFPSFAWSSDPNHSPKELPLLSK